MEDILRQLSVILRGMWLYRWWGLAAAWIVGPIAAAAVYLQPDRYEASARVYVDTQSILKPLMSGLAVQPNVDQQINILSRTLISRPNVEKLIRMADLDLAAKTKEEREALIVTVTKALQIREAGRDNIYTLAYTTPMPSGPSGLSSRWCRSSSSPGWGISARTPTPPGASSRIRSRPTSSGWWMQRTDSRSTSCAT